MIHNELIIKEYMESTVNSVYKILPLWEERNIGLNKYIESLVLELYGLSETIEVDNYVEYMSVLNILNGLKVNIGTMKKKEVKREVFKAIDKIKRILERS